MRRLDTYLVRTFLAPFAVATFALVGLLIVAEILTHMDRFILYSPGFWRTLGTIGVIYLFKAPAFLCLITPMTILVGAAFGMTQLTRHNELTAMKACGVSLLRVLAPVFAAAAVICLLSGAMREFLVPVAEQKAIPLFCRAIGEEERFADVMGVVPEERCRLTEVRDGSAGGDGAGPPWSLEGADPAYRGKYSFVLRRLRGLDIVLSFADGRIVHVEAAEARHHARGGAWDLDNVVVDNSLRLPRVRWQTGLSPRDLSYHRLPLSVRPLREVLRFVRAHPAHSQYRVLLLSRLTYPLTGIILLMLGLPLVLSQESLLRTALLGMGVAIAVCLLYFGIQFVSYHLGEDGQLPPSVAVLAPVVLGLAAGGYLLDTLRT